MSLVQVPGLSALGGGATTGASFRWRHEDLSVDENGFVPTPLIRQA